MPLGLALAQESSLSFCHHIEDRFDQAFIARGGEVVSWKVVEEGVAQFARGSLHRAVVEVAFSTPEQQWAAPFFERLDRRHRFVELEEASLQGVDVIHARNQSRA